MKDKPQTPSFRYVPGALLGQLATLQTAAADVARTVAEVRGGQSAPPEASAPLGAATARVALSAAPLLDKYRQTLTAEVPFSGEDLRSDEAALRAATDIKAIADFVSGQAGELVAFYRGRLGERTRDVVTLFQSYLQNPFLDPALRPELAADCRPMFGHVQPQDDSARRPKDADPAPGAPLRATTPAPAPRRGRGRRR